MEYFNFTDKEVLDFIHKRFSKDNNWLTGNCYYFAVILKTRFPEGIILYDVIDGHFVLQYNGIKYDWSGVYEENNEHCWIEWDLFDSYDSIQKEVIVRDCIL